MKSREIFDAAMRIIGILIFCYGIMAGIFGTMTFYLMDKLISLKLTNALNELLAIFSTSADSGIESAKGPVFLFLILLFTQGLLPILLGLFLMGTDLLVDFAYPLKKERITDDKHDSLRTSHRQQTTLKFDNKYMDEESRYAPPKYRKETKPPTGGGR